MTPTPVPKNAPVLVIYTEAKRIGGQPDMRYHLSRFVSQDEYVPVQFADNRSFLQAATHLGSANNLEELAELYYRGDFGRHNALGIITTLNVRDVKKNIPKTNDDQNGQFSPVKVEDLVSFKERYLLGPLC